MNPILKKGTWLVGVSGGPDSMALVHMCTEEGIQIAAAHVNYHHRPSADSEEAYVRAYCKKFGIPCFVLNTPFEYKGNFEAEARIRRYDFFVQTVKDNGYAGILIAHQRDDVLETWLMQQERHLMVQCFGLAEDMEYEGVRVVRPLLDRTKAELQQYCDRNGVRYWIDESNNDLSYARNRMRHTVVAEMSEQEQLHMLQEIQQANDELKKLRLQAGKLIRENGIAIREYRESSLEVRLAALRMLISDAGIKADMSRAFMEQLDSICMRHNDFDQYIKGAYELVQDGGIMHIFREVPLYEYTYAYAEETEIPFPAFIPADKQQRSLFTAAVTADDFPIVCRCFQPGDSIQMRYGTKSLHRFFIDRHIPLYQRRYWPVIVNRNNAIILVPGLGCDRDHYSIKANLVVL